MMWNEFMENSVRLTLTMVTQQSEFLFIDLIKKFNPGLIL